MLDADMNARYWKCLVAEHSRRDKGLKIFVALTASGTVAGWGIWESFPALWKSLSALSAVVAILLPLLKDQKRIEQMSVLAGRWSELRIEYEDLWLQVRRQENEAELAGAFKKFRRVEASLEKIETGLPRNNRVLKKCFDEVKRARGLLQKGDAS